MAENQKPPQAGGLQGADVNSRITPADVSDLPGEHNPLAIEPVLVEQGGRFIGADTVTGALHLMDDRQPALTLRQIRERLDTLTCIAYGAEVSRRIADDETAELAESEQARESAEVMLREIVRGVAELHAQLAGAGNG